MPTSTSDIEDLVRDFEALATRANEIIQNSEQEERDAVQSQKLAFSPILSSAFTIVASFWRYLPKIRVVWDDSDAVMVTSRFGIAYRESRKRYDLYDAQKQMISGGLMGWYDQLNEDAVAALFDSLKILLRQGLTGLANEENAKEDELRTRYKNFKTQAQSLVELIESLP